MTSHNMKTRYYFYIISVLFLNCNEKKEIIDPVKEEAFFKEQKEFASVWKYINNNFYSLYSLDQSNFTQKIDSLEKTYTDHLQKNRNNLNTVAEGKYLPSFKEFTSILITFAMTVFGWIFFRADTIQHAFDYIFKILSPSLFDLPKFTGMRNPLPTIILVCIFIIVEWSGREGQYAISNIGLKWKSSVRQTMYYAIVFLIFWFGGKEQQFIYFQF